MLAEARRRAIADLVVKNGQVSTEMLASELDVSVETIRRDLHFLEDQNSLKRVHGGAVPVRPLLSREPDYVERSQHASHSKRAIAKAVVRHIPLDATVFLDLGTTVDVVAAELPDDFSGTIVTTSVRVASQLARLDKAEIFVPGGRLRHHEQSLSGATTVSFLEGFFPQIAVISCGAVEAEHGVTDFAFEDLHVKRTALKNSQHKFVVADSSKFGTVAPYKVCGLDVPDFIVTSDDLDAECRVLIEEQGGNLLLAETAS